MNMKFTFIINTALLLGLSTAPGRAQESGDDLARVVSALRAEVAQIKANEASAERVAELERRLDLLASELERARTGGVAETEAPAKGEYGFAPAASKVYRKASGVSLGGYGEALYQNFAARAEDGTASARQDRLDLVRIVLYTGYKFSDRILFNSEIEFEHATTGEGAEERGEVSVEFGYLDFKPWRNTGIRAGMVLLPLGFVNELHEPPIFLSARRPEVEQAIIPATWREVGAGVFGETGPLQWRAYVVAGLNSSGFTSGGIREGRQQGSQSLAEDLALTGRVDYLGAPGLLLGASALSGGSGQGASVDGRPIKARVTVLDVHAQYEHRGLWLRALYARTSLGDAALINAQNGFNGSQSVGSRQHGFYAEAGYDVMNAHPRGQWAVVPFLRYERLNTQAQVPDGFEKNPALDRRVLTAGLSVRPLTNVAIKADYQAHWNRARTGVGRFNLALGFLF